MALSGLYCPKCSKDLRDKATECLHCHTPIGEREWKQALDNEYLKAFEKYGMITFIRCRIIYAFKLKVYAVKSFFRAAGTAFRRQFVRFI